MDPSRMVRGTVNRVRRGNAVDRWLIALCRLVADNVVSMSIRRSLALAVILSPVGAAAQSVVADTTFPLSTRGTETTSIEEFAQAGNAILG